MPYKCRKKSYLLEKNPDYYFRELRANAIREKKRKRSRKRKDELRRLNRERRKFNKGLPARFWTDEEIEFLHKNYKEKEYQWIARKLGRSTTSIEHKVSRLGLLKNNKWTT
jgi:organic radical activating enzyme